MRINSRAVLRNEKRRRGRDCVKDSFRNRLAATNSFVQTHTSVKVLWLRMVEAKGRNPFPVQPSRAFTVVWKKYQRPYKLPHPLYKTRFSFIGHADLNS